MIGSAFAKYDFSKISSRETMKIDSVVRHRQALSEKKVHKIFSSVATFIDTHFTAHHGLFYACRIFCPNDMKDRDFVTIDKWQMNQRL